MNVVYFVAGVGWMDRHVPGASSHWRQMLAGFDGSPRSLRGVSSLEPPSRNLLHRLFQIRYFSMVRSAPRLSHFLHAGRKVARRQGRAFDLNMLRQVLTLAVCDAHCTVVEEGSYAVIGDGYGALISILLEALPKSRVVAVNLAPVLEIDRSFVRMAHGQTERATFIASSSANALLGHRFHVSFNIASMQEMDPQEIDKYFSLIRQTSNYLYCCNRVSKALPDGAVIEFAKYPWHHDDAFLIDELCPWHQSYYAFRPPFYRRFDGPLWHRLVALSGHARARNVTPAGRQSSNTLASMPSSGVQD